jgi:hypothetical protein
MFDSQVSRWFPVPRWNRMRAVQKPSFIPFPKVAVPTATTSALAETSGRNLQESTGKTLFLWWEKARVYHGVLFPKAAEDVWRCMDHNGSYYHILSLRPMGKTGTHIYCRDGVASFIATIQGLERTHIPWHGDSYQWSTGRWPELPSAKAGECSLHVSNLHGASSFAWNVLLWYPLAN